MRRVIALAIGACLFASPALAAFTLTFVTNSFTSNAAGSVHSASSGNVTLGAGTMHLILGAIVGLNASSDLVSVTDAAGNYYAVYQCPQTAGSLNVGFVAWSVLTAGLSAQPFTVADTTNGSTNIGASGAITAYSFTLSGALLSNPEDVAVRACAGSTTATTSPTVTTGTPSQTGDFLFTVYFSPTNESGFSYTGDAGHGWSAIGGVVGNTRAIIDGDTQTNAGSGSKIDNPTTQSASYSLLSVGFLPSTASSYGGLTTLGAGQ